MNVSGSEERSATKTIDLKARLREMQAQHASRVQEIEKEAFENFERDLRTLLRAEATIFANDFDGLNAAFSQQAERLKEEVVAETGRMLWIVKLPVMITVLACIAMVGLCLVWFQVQTRERVRQSRWQQDGRSYLIVDDPSWQLCRMGQIGLGSTSKTDAIILQPCKPLE